MVERAHFKKLDRPLSENGENRRAIVIISVLYTIYVMEYAVAIVLEADQ